MELADNQCSWGWPCAILSCSTESTGVGVCCLVESRWAACVEPSSCVCVPSSAFFPHELIKNDNAKNSANNFFMVILIESKINNGNNSPLSRWRLNQYDKRFVRSGYRWCPKRCVRNRKTRYSFFPERKWMLWYRNNRWWNWKFDFGNMKLLNRKFEERACVVVRIKISRARKMDYLGQ